MLVLFTVILIWLGRELDCKKRKFRMFHKIQFYHLGSFLSENGKKKHSHYLTEMSKLSNFPSEASFISGTTSSTFNALEKNHIKL